MADNFRLLFNTIISKSLSAYQLIVISAEGVACQRQENTLLMLPDMDHLVNEQRLDVARRSAKIIAEQIAFGMKPQIAIRRHRDAAVLERPPLAIEYRHVRIVDC